MINKLLEFINQAGEIALSIQDDIDLSDEQFQKDYKVFNVVTKADLDISELFERFIKNNFSNLDYIIVDEEKISNLGNDPVNKIKNAEYAFVIDPIDGTQLFAMKMPEFGISIGVLRYGKPYIGVIYCPAIKEVVFFDGENSYWLQNAFSEKEKKNKLVKRDINPRAIVFDSSWNVMINNNIDFTKDTVMGLYSAVMHMLYIATGRGKCYYFNVYLWDMTGGWPIAKNLGFEFINYVTGSILEEVSEKEYDEKIKVKVPHIICKPEDFKHFKDIADLRNMSWYKN